MSNEARDPREEVLVGIINTGIQSGQWKEGWTNEALTRLDAADPRLALWGELVAAAAIAYAHGYESGHQDTCDGYYMPERKLEDFVAEHGLLARARAVDATNQGGDATLSDRGEA